MYFIRSAPPVDSGAQLPDLTRHRRMNVCVGALVEEMGTTRKGRFVVKRKTMSKWMRAKLKAVKETLRGRKQPPFRTSESVCGWFVRTIPTRLIPVGCTIF